MKGRLLVLAGLLAALWMSPPSLAAPAVPLDLADPTLLLKLSEAGGPTLAVVLAVYWLRECYQRRLEESQSYATSLLELKHEYRELAKSLRSSGKEVAEDE
jgi:hypothetical protein